VLEAKQISSLKGIGLGDMPNAVSILERPVSVKGIAVSGHWKEDLMEGSGKTFIATLVERQLRYVMRVKLKDKKLDSVYQRPLNKLTSFP
jgi:IS30 family transposase